MANVPQLREILSINWPNFGSIKIQPPRFSAGSDSSALSFGASLCDVCLLCKEQIKDEKLCEFDSAHHFSNLDTWEGEKKYRKFKDIIDGKPPIASNSTFPPLTSKWTLIKLWALNWMRGCENPTWSNQTSKWLTRWFGFNPR